MIDPTSGEVTGFVDIVRDISAHKALEAELKQSALAAEAAVVAKSDFLANMSHEIRTPLTAIVGFSGLLENVEALPADARLYVKRIVAGGRSLLSVVNDILDFSKLEANQVELDPQPFSPAWSSSRARWRWWRRRRPTRGWRWRCAWTRTCRPSSTPTARGCARCCSTC